MFLGMEMLKSATFDAMLTFNEGCMARVNVLKAFGILPWRNTVMWLGEVDRRRLYFAKRGRRHDKTSQGNKKTSKEVTR